MHIKVLTITLLLFNLGLFVTAQDFAKLVDPQIGSHGDGLRCGYSFIGATYPFGMIQFSPGFFTPQRGFAVTQLNGAGCANMGNFPVLPLAGKLSSSPNQMDGIPAYKKVNEACAGYLSVKMEDQTLAELTVNKRSAIARFTYNSDMGTVIIGSGINATSVDDARVEITSPSTCEGYSSGGEFCGNQTRYKIYFAAEFNRMANYTGTWMGDALLDSLKLAYGKSSGAYFTFNTKKNKEVNYRIAISFVSVQNAKENLKQDNTSEKFEDYKRNAISVWNKTLAKISVKSDNLDRKVQFYTHLYHCLIHPNIVNDSNGEYIGADFVVHKADKGRDQYSSFSEWDTYRTQCQMVAILFPKESSDMMQSLVEFASQSGGYGRWILANIETGIMQGDPAPILISNSYAFGATDFDVKTAYKYMKQGSMRPLLRSQNQEIRPFLTEYIKYGIAPASMLLEYTSSDYAIGQFAKQALNNNEDAAFFINRSQNWKNLYNPKLNWLCSKETNGKWKDISDGWNEASYKNYFWMVPYNLKTLIDTIGGKIIAEKRLDDLFVRLDAKYDNDWFAAGNEPDFQVPWIYNWTDSPNKTSAVIHRILKDVYNSSTSGLPGNDDLGAMGAWYVFASIGLFPMTPGIAGFSVNTPQFDEIKIELPQGELLISGGSPEKSFIHSLKLNNKLYKNSTWINWNDIKSGGNLEFEASETSIKK